ncbi:MAG TPA: NAD(P)-binding domain-containing protein [Nitrososphaerales archaeon]|nr:NAD(P)-binding domain-containing protein [Nitrososphaerales archaeon]
MRIAVLGGTGSVGGAIAKQLSRKYEIIIGSRDPARAVEAAKRIRGGTGADYATASRQAGAVVFSLPYSALGTAAELTEELSGKLVISPVNPLRFEGGLTYYGLEKGSAAQELAKLIPRSRVATAFNNVPALFLQRDDVVPMDVLIAADARETYDEAAGIVGSIPNVRPLYAGPLSQAGVVEAMTSMVLNLASLNKTGNLTIRFASRKG